MLDWGTPRYLEQLERTRRWLGRIQDQNRPQQEYLDDLYAFFVACWHLKDWVAKDPSVGDDAKKGVDDALKKDKDDYLAIQTCADIANLVKHLQRDEKRKPYVDASIAGASVVLCVGVETTVAWNYFVMPGRQSALELADRAVKEWIQVLRAHGLAAS